MQCHRIISGKKRITDIQSLDSIRFSSQSRTGYLQLQMLPLLSLSWLLRAFPELSRFTEDVPMMMTTTPPQPIQLLQQKKAQNMPTFFFLRITLPTTKLQRWQWIYIFRVFVVLYPNPCKLKFFVLTSTSTYEYMISPMPTSMQVPGTCTIS